MESLINKFTNECIFSTYLMSGGFEMKENG